MSESRQVGIATGSSSPQQETKTPHTPVTKNVYVVSSADKVELLINGKSQGFGTQSSRFLFTFKDIAWQPGTISAVGYDAAGRRTSEDQKQTAGEPFAIRLTTKTGPLGLRADGADVALVDVEVVDAKGRRCPTALNLINFSLSGPAEWRGAQCSRRSDTAAGADRGAGASDNAIQKSLEPTQGYY